MTPPAPAPETTPSIAEPADILARFAHAMEHHGIDVVPADTLAALVDAARSCGVSEVLIAVLVDPTEPAVTRQRAFAKVAAKVIFAAGGPASTTSAEPTSPDLAGAFGA